jgi:N-acetyl-gamma-glutamylphosphate reductase
MSQSTCTLTAARRSAAAWPGHAAAVIGGSGYTGLVLAELLLRHPSIRLIVAEPEMATDRHGDPVDPGCVGRVRHVDTAVFDVRASHMIPVVASPAA